MCRGLAILCDKQGRFSSKGISSHSNSLGKLKEDDCLKFEVIIDNSKKEGYSVEVDEQYEKNSKQGKEAKSMLKECEKWVKHNELQVLRWLLNNRTYARNKRNQDMSSCKAGKNQNMSSCKAGKNQNMSSCKAGENQNMSSCKAGKNQNMRYCEAKNRFISYMKITGEKGDEQLNNFINELSDKAEHHLLEWRTLVKLAIKGHNKLKVKKQ